MRRKVPPDLNRFLIRPFEDADAKAAGHLFYAAVHQGTRAHYSKEERQAWAARVPPEAKWRKRLASQITFVALHGKTLAGFMTLAPDGYIDLAFMAPDYIGRGVAKRLYDAIETKASEMELSRLYTRASPPAPPRIFFARQGWVVVNQQVIMRNNTPLTNFIMEKPLNSRNN